MKRQLSKLIGFHRFGDWVATTQRSGGSGAALQSRDANTRASQGETAISE